MSRDLFDYRHGELYFNNHQLTSLASVQNYHQPFYLYDLNLIQERLDAIKSWKGLHRLHYAMKANYSEEVLKLILKNGCGLDVVSLGEIQHGLSCGFSPSDIIFSGVGKTKTELRWAIQNDIYQINVESLSELQRVAALCEEQKKTASIGLRLNPEVDAKTHPHIATALHDSKFGFSMSDLPEINSILQNNPRLKLVALSYHLGSQIVEAQVYEEAIVKIKPLYLEMRKKFPTLQRLDVGGGIGLNYHDHDLSHDFKRWDQIKQIYSRELNDFGAEVLFEIGRFLVARAAVLVAQVQYIKKTEYKNFAILDVGMNNLMRPMLYKAYHHIYPLIKKTNPPNEYLYCVVGPLCESTDVFHHNIQLSELKSDDLVIIADVGAYCKSMASHYNLQPIAQDSFL